MASIRYCNMYEEELYTFINKSSKVRPFLLEYARVLVDASECASASIPRS